MQYGIIKSYKVDFKEVTIISGLSGKALPVWVIVFIIKTSSVEMVISR